MFRLVRLGSGALVSGPGSPRKERWRRHGRLNRGWQPPRSRACLALGDDINKPALLGSGSNFRQGRSRPASAPCHSRSSGRACSR